MPTLNWIGKDKVINHHLDVPFHTLDKQYTVGDSDSGNKIINGDNLVALKALLPEYEGKIKCIYIDPPYNTGNEGWIYNDNVNAPQIKRWLGQVVGKEGEDLSRHDKWLCMMYPRLQLLHKLLADDGAIFISIDDNEQANLKLLCDEIFGESNFINNIIWEKKYSPQNDAKYFSDNHDFILVYAKNKEKWKPGLLPRTEEMNARYKNIDNDPRGPWKPGDCSVKTYSSNYDFPITTPSGRIVNPPQGRCWRFSKDIYVQLLNENRIWFGNNGDNVPSLKRFLSEVKQGTTSMTIWKYTEVGHNQDAKQEIKDIFSDSKFPFDTPKPTRLINRILQIATDTNSIILDSFAGSGTTAHAVLNLNKKDGGNRKFILVEMEDYAETITAERVKRVINGYGEGDKAVEGTGGGFDYFSLGKTIFNADGNLNEDVGVEKIREYIWYSETGTSLPSHLNEYFLGSYNATDYYFYYEQNEETILTRENIGTIIKQKAEGYIIYADACQIEKKFMETNNITFKRIPRDIKKL
ncbi:MAG: site-specific DNA-methyltransferase [Paludibacteraceae bacterium]|nr:site-specific DNA-methyltransferase [Paludibacteraceae bacterium]